MEHNKNGNNDAMTFIFEKNLISFSYNSLCPFLSFLSTFFFFFETFLLSRSLHHLPQNCKVAFF